MSPDIKYLTLQEEERFLDILKNRKDAERAYMLYHLMLITGLRLSEALSLNVEHASRAKVGLKVKGWTKNKPEGYGLVSNNQSHKTEGSGLPSSGHWQIENINRSDGEYRFIEFFDWRNEEDMMDNNYVIAQALSVPIEKKLENNRILFKYGDIKFYKTA